MKQNLSLQQQKVFLQISLSTSLPYLFFKSKCGWQLKVLCLKTQRQEMFPGVMSSTCSVMDADMSTSTLAAS